MTIKFINKTSSSKAFQNPDEKNALRRILYYRFKFILRILFFTIIFLIEIKMEKLCISNEIKNFTIQID